MGVDRHTGVEHDTSHVRVEIHEARVVHEMVGKIADVAATSGAARAVAEWQRRNPTASCRPDGYSFAVVGETLMYLHVGPDGMVFPHACYPDGTEKIYTDRVHFDHARA